MNEISDNFTILINRVEELSKFVRDINGRLSRIEGGVVLAGAIVACGAFGLLMKYLFR